MFLFETADGGMETLHSAGDRSQICVMCVCLKRERESGQERGRLFSGHAKEEGDALVTCHNVSQHGGHTQLL